jgi:hypothetical protein
LPMYVYCLVRTIKPFNLTVRVFKRKTLPILLLDLYHEIPQAKVFTIYLDVLPDDRSKDFCTIS